jgi:DNA-binding PadR family transcriptional regulator
MRGCDITLNVLRVSRLFLSTPNKWRYGLDVAKRLELPTSTAYNVLYQLRRERWMDARQEPHRLGGEPGRRLYCLTAFGRQCANEALSSLEIYST